MHPARREFLKGGVVSVGASDGAFLWQQVHEMLFVEKGGEAQIQDEQVRVTGKNRDDLQTAIAHLRGEQEKLKVPMQFGNFRE